MARHYYDPDMLDRMVALWEINLSYEAIAAVIRLDFQEEVTGRQVRSKIAWRNRRLGIKTTSRARLGISNDSPEKYRYLEAVAANG